MYKVTSCLYKSNKFTFLVFVFQLRYPDSCLEFKYDNSFPIRGLYYDKSKGCLIKLDFFGSIEPGGCYFGRRKVFYQSICLLNVLLSIWFLPEKIYLDRNLSSFFIKFMGEVYLTFRKELNFCWMSYTSSMVPLKLI